MYVKMSLKFSMFVNKPSSVGDDLYARMQLLELVMNCEYLLIAFHENTLYIQ